MKVYLLIIIGFLFSETVAQKIDLSGNWIGTATYLNDQIHLRYELEQNGKEIRGTVFSRNVNTNDSIKVSVTGEINKHELELRGIKIIYKTGLSCMANNVLAYSINQENDMLSGRWKGDMRLNTCPPLVSGNVTLFRENEPIEIATSTIRSDAEASTPTVTIRQEDELAKTLIDELSDRKYYALIIGINQYNDEQIQNLDNPIDDAKRLADVLLRYYSFEKEQLTLLENPSRENMIKALDELAKVVTEKDNLLIFYAGHGIWNAQLNQGYWLPTDASFDSRSYWLSNSTIRDYVGGIKAKHTLLISDACFSGGILKERAAFANSRAILELYKLPSRKAMTSGTLKTVPDKSVFIEYLLKNLITNHAPLLSADQLFRQFKIAVINNSPNGQVPQYGPITQTGDEGGDFIFLKRQ